MGLFFFVWAGACADEVTRSDDDDDDGSRGTGQGGSVTTFVGSSCSRMTTTSGGGTSGTTTTSAGTGLDCTQACNVIYQCGAAEDGALCPGFGPGGTDLATFVNGPTGNDGCLATCNATPLLTQLVDPNDCAYTINKVRGANTSFQEACDGLQ